MAHIDIDKLCASPDISKNSHKTKPNGSTAFARLTFLPHTLSCKLEQTPFTHFDPEVEY